MGTAKIETTGPKGEGEPLRVRVVGGAGSRAGLDEGAWAKVEAALRRCLHLDARLDAFYDRCRAAGPPFDEAPRMGFGRLLRSPTAFEDMVKVLATTNTTWSGTVGMVRRLVEIAGDDGTFPGPERIAAVGAERLRDSARWGYRAEYLDALARAIVDGELDPEAWEGSGTPTEAIADEIGGLRGFGPYATAQTLALLGRYDRIGVDTVFRDFVGRRHFGAPAERPSDRRMLEVYEPWGEWKALAYWFEMWREAVEDEEWRLEEER